MVATPPDGALSGQVVAVTAERRREEQAGLLERRGATVLEVPTVHTVDLTADEALRATTRRVIERPPGWLVATTGFGMRLWFDAADAWGLGEDLVAALSAAKVVARGPKAQSACRQRGLEVVWRAPDESMAAVVAWLRDRRDLGDASLVLQLFDPADHPATAEVAAIVGEVVPVAVYRWRLPDDVEPIVDLVHRIGDGGVDAVTFTSQPAVRFLLEVAETEGRRGDVVAALDDGQVVPVCVGPVCAQALVEAGIHRGVWPEPFRLVPMVKLVEQQLAAARLVRVDPRSPDAREAVSAYVAELDRRFDGGFDPGDALDAEAAGFVPPAGTFVVARQEGAVVGCGAVQTLAPGIAEIKRMWVSPAARGQGLGRRLLTELERRAGALGHARVRLDTNAALTEAVGLYRRAGYVEIERYNDNPHAERFFEKRLGTETDDQLQAPA